MISDVEVLDVEGVVFDKFEASFFATARAIALLILQADRLAK